MTDPSPTIRVKLDPCNPGQFFACCGLLELADRLWGSAMGWFIANHFHLSPIHQDMRESANPDKLIEGLSRCRITNTMTTSQQNRLAELSAMKGRAKGGDLEAEKKALDSLRREAPIRLHAPFNLLIDWFLDESAGGSRFKTWAGQQSVIDIAQGMHRPLLNESWSTISPEAWLSESASINDLPFNFDSGLSGQGSAIDAGFSFDSLGFKMPVRPLLELAAFVGLQRFRPSQAGRENLYRFVLWPNPLPPSVAAAVASGAVEVFGGRRYEFRLLYRTKYLKSFLPAQPQRGNFQ